MVLITIWMIISRWQCLHCCSYLRLSLFIWSCGVWSFTAGSVEPSFSSKSLCHSTVLCNVPQSVAAVSSDRPPPSFKPCRSLWFSRRAWCWWLSDRIRLWTVFQSVRLSMKSNFTWFQVAMLSLSVWSEVIIGEYSLKSEREKTKRIDTFISSFICVPMALSLAKWNFIVERWSLILVFLLYYILNSVKKLPNMFMIVFSAYRLSNFSLASFAVLHCCVTRRALLRRAYMIIFSALPLKLFSTPSLINVWDRSLLCSVAFTHSC